MAQSWLCSNSGACAVKIKYDKLNRLSTVTVAGQVPTTYGYDAVGNLGGYTYPNGVSTALQYDGLNRLTALSSQAQLGTVASYRYTLGAAGNRTGVTELSGRTVAYTYDNLYRLTSETIANDVVGVNGSLGYQYDAVGNRQQMASTLMPLPSGLWNYDANDRLTTDTYDNDGNTVSRAGVANTYDFENHLASWGYITYVYDGDGNRVAKTIGGVTTNYLVDTLNPTGYAQVLDELQSSAVVRSYAWGLQLVSQSQLVAAVPPASPWQTSYYGFDGHGSVRFLTNSTGAVTDTYTYDAFGNLIESTGTTANNYLFAGEQFDPDINLYYNRARYLDVRVGRFWGMDTEEGDDDNPLSLHKYLYANANPVDGTDPSGNDDIAGMMVGMSMSMTINSMPSLQSQTYIGGQNADPDLDIRKAIADTARSYVGSHNWLDTAGSNKCNAFVFDVLTQVGHAPPKLGGSIRYLLGYQLGVTSLLKYAPIAGQWADASIDIPNWTVVSAGPQQAQPGDIIAEKINYSDASGHVGIVVGSQQTASADSTAKPPGTITISNYGFRSASDKRPYGKASNSVVRRFSVFQADAPLGGGGADAF